MKALVSRRQAEPLLLMVARHTGRTWSMYICRIYVHMHVPLQSVAGAAVLRLLIGYGMLPVQVLSPPSWAHGTPSLSPASMQRQGAEYTCIKDGSAVISFCLSWPY